MEANLTSVKGMMMFSDTTFAIPKYQRAYSWKTEDVDSILNEIVEVLHKKKEIIFLGNIILYKRNDINSYDVVDGQQRVVTLFLITLAMRDLMKDMESVYSDWASSMIDNFLCINAFNNKKKAIKLHANNKDREALESIFNNNGVVIKDRVNGNINTNYEYIQKRLKEVYLEFNDQTKFFDAAFNVLSENIQLVKIVIEDNDPIDPQEVFDTFNGTGVPLTILDLIRNYILMDKSNKKLTHQWEEFEDKLNKKFNNSIQKQDEFLYGYIKDNLKKDIPYEEAYKGFKEVFKGIKREEVIKRLTKALLK